MAHPFTIRTSKPGKGNKNYMLEIQGGWNTCIAGKPMDVNCHALANCVGYASGRFNEIYNEIKGTTGNHFKFLNCDAENFHEYAARNGLKVVQYPTLGGIMVFAQGDTKIGEDGHGHVMSVERIDSKNKFFSSESNYGGTAFLNVTRTNDNGRWGMGPSFRFVGCIVNPAVGDVHWVEPVKKPEPQPTYKFKVGDKVVINGKIYYRATDKTSSGTVTNKTTKITRIAKGTAHPYNTTGDLGWMDEASIKLAPVTKEVKVGATVTLKKPVDYKGTSLAATTSEKFVVTELVGDRAVIKKNKKDQWAFAAVKKSNLKAI